MSIFSKICPRCAGENPVSGSRCQCGFVFDTSATTGSFKALEMAVQEAEVYAEYLHMRMKQAKEVAEVAIAEQARASGDSAKPNVANAANEEYLTAKAEYDEQMKIVAQLRREAQVVQDKEIQENRQAQWARAEQRSKEKKAALAQKQAVNSGKKPAKPPAKPKTATKDTAPTAPAKLASRPNAGRASPPPAMRQKMANAADSTAERVRKAQSAIKQELAAANQALQRKPASEAPGGKKPVAAPAKTATPQFTATQAAKAQMTVKECPNCTAMVALEVTECKCGFGFASSAQKMDGIVLSEEDRALFSLFRPVGTS